MIRPIAERTLEVEIQMPFPRGFELYCQIELYAWPLLGVATIHAAEDVAGNGLHVVFCIFGATFVVEKTCPQHFSRLQRHVLADRERKRKQAALHIFANSLEWVRLGLVAGVVAAWAVACDSLGRESAFHCSVQAQEFHASVEDDDSGALLVCKDCIEYFQTVFGVTAFWELLLLKDFCCLFVSHGHVWAEPDKFWRHYCNIGHARCVDGKSCLLRNGLISYLCTAGKLPLHGTLLVPLQMMVGIVPKLFGLVGQSLLAQSSGRSLLGH